MAGKVLNIQISCPLKHLLSLTGNYRAICHYSYNLQLATIGNDRQPSIEINKELTKHKET